MKHTKGKCIARDIDNKRSVVLVDFGSSTQSICHLYERPNKEHKGNAKLIAEAFNVANETGYTPRQLADKVEEQNTKNLNTTKKTK